MPKENHNTLYLDSITHVLVLDCSPGAKSKSEADISSGNQKLVELDERRKVEDATGNDYDKMTQVAPNLEEKAMADYDKTIQDDPDNSWEKNNEQGRDFKTIRRDSSLS